MFLESKESLQLSINEAYEPFETGLVQKEIKFHDLRHTFASHLVMSGVDLKTVQELLGHKTMDMTMRYPHLSPAHKRVAVEMLDSRIHTP